MLYTDIHYSPLAARCPLPPARSLHPKPQSQRSVHRSFLSFPASHVTLETGAFAHPLLTPRIAPIILTTSPASLGS
jgi:hypothetical protein